MRNWTYLAVAAGTLALGAASSQAALITFSGVYPNPQGAGIPAAYQPLQTGYGSGDSYLGAGTGRPGSAADGGALGVTITWDGVTSDSNPYVNGGVTDHTGDTAHEVGYDNGNGTMTIIFSKAVEIPSLYFANYNAGNYTMEFQGYTNAGDATPVVDTGAIPYAQPTGYTWIQLTALAGTPIKELIVSGAPYKQLDDITVNLAPEPASLGLLGLATLGFLRRRRV